MTVPDWDSMTLDQVIETLKTLTIKLTNETYPNKYTVNEAYLAEFLEGVEYSSVSDRYIDHHVYYVDSFRCDKGYDEQEYWVVVKVGSRHIKFEGWCGSWTGPEMGWEDAFFVEAKPVTRTEWVRV